MSEPLDRLIEELESVAARLKEGDVEPAEAADLVERCAELAAGIGGELDAESRSAGETEGQERLL
jgi:hypothetical protein